MPQVLALVIAGAGLYAGLKWVARHLSGPKANAPLRGDPKDLGTLEYDPEARVYRPRAK